MTKKELIESFINIYRCKNYSLALAAKRQDAMKVLQIKTELNYLLRVIVPTVLGGQSNSYKAFRKQIFETLEEQRETKPELNTEFVI